MKKFLNKCLQGVLKIFGSLILNKYKPEIIGITGSVGKTSTKEAVFEVLKNKFSVRTNIKNYNNEIGLPLTIIGLNSGGSSLRKWFSVIMSAIKLLIIKDKNYPKILVLEMAADRPGDMKYLTDFASCRVGIITNVSHAHYEYFGSMENIAKEKSVMVTHLKKDGWAILNNDDGFVSQMKDKTKAQIVTFGIKNSADVMATDISMDDFERLNGLNFKLAYNGKENEADISNISSEHFIYAVLIATTVGLIYDMELEEISRALRNYKAPKGRMNVIKGINGSIIIDDTYNAGPESTVAAIKAVAKMNGKRKIAVLGNMLELGDYAEDGHRLVGSEIVKNNFDLFFGVGDGGEVIADQIKNEKFATENIFTFTNRVDLIEALEKTIINGDIILVKGSQGARMEKIVKGIMAEPERSKELLVRQEDTWL